MAQAQTVYVLSWKIQQDDKMDGVGGVYDNLPEAQRSALISINENWVQGDWSVYDDETVALMRQQIRTKNYAAALKTWESLSSAYEVEITETVIDTGNVEYDLDGMFDD